MSITQYRLEGFKSLGFDQRRSLSCIRMRDNEVTSAVRELCAGALMR